MSSKQTHPVQVRLSPDLLKDLEEMADGIPLATFARALLQRAARDWRVQSDVLKVLDGQAGKRG